MTPEELKKLVDGDPDTLFKELKLRGLDLNDVPNNFAKDLVTRRFSINDNQFKAVDFVFWISYFVERMADEFIIDPEVHVGARQEAMETIVKSLSLGQKIQIIEDLHTSKSDPLIKLMRDIKKLRNDVAHGRFDNLKYGGYTLDDNFGQLKMIAHLRDVNLKK